MLSNIGKAIFQVSVYSCKVGNNQHIKKCLEFVVIKRTFFFLPEIGVPVDASDVT